MHPGTRPRLWPSGPARAGTGWQGVGWAFVAAPTPPPLPGELAGVGKAGRGQLQLQAQHLSWTSKAFPIHPPRLLSESPSSWVLRLRPTERRQTGCCSPRGDAEGPEARKGWVELPPACRWQAAAFSQEGLQLTGAWPHSVLRYQPQPEGEQGQAWGQESPQELLCKSKPVCLALSLPG